MRFLASKNARMEIWNQPDKRDWTPLAIADSIQRGMNIVGSAPTAAAIREVMANTTARPLNQSPALQQFEPLRRQP